LLTVKLIYKNPENPCGIRIFGHCKRMKTDEKTDRTGVEKDEVIEKTGFQCGNQRI